MMQAHFRVCSRLPHGVCGMLKERIAVLQLERDRATAALERIKAQAVPPTSLEPAAIKRFGRLMRESVTCGDMPFRKAYRRPFSIVPRSTTISSVSSGESHAGAGDCGQCRTDLGGRRSVRRWRAAPGDDENYVYATALL